VGRVLGEQVLEQARNDGFRGMQFNAVVETNTRAVALWRSLGLKVVGTLPEGFRHPVHGYVGLHIMHRAL
jgi:ribosomal protein S18 acetylase RimI-like enzyme